MLSKIVAFFSDIFNPFCCNLQCVTNPVKKNGNCINCTVNYIWYRGGLHSKTHPLFRNTSCGERRSGVLINNSLLFNPAKRVVIILLLMNRNKSTLLLRILLKISETISINSSELSRRVFVLRLTAALQI